MKPFADAEGKLRDVGEEMEINSTLGIDIVAKGYAKEVKEAPPKEVPIKPAAGTGAEIKDLSEVVPKAVDVEGEQRNCEELVGKVIVLEKFGLRPSQYEGRDEYATIQITEDNGVRAWFNTGSGPILDTLKQIEGSLPVRCRIERRKSKAGQRYFTLVGTEQD